MRPLPTPSLSVHLSPLRLHFTLVPLAFLFFRHSWLPHLHPPPPGETGTPPSVNVCGQVTEGPSSPLPSGPMDVTLRAEGFEDVSCTLGEEASLDAFAEQVRAAFGVARHTTVESVLPDGSVVADAADLRALSGGDVVSVRLTAAARGVTALHVAAKGLCPAAALRALAADETLAEARDPLGRTAVHGCVCPHVLAALLDTGRLAVDARDDAGTTPLSDAAADGRHRLCTVLLDSGADVGARDARGRTPLHRVKGGDVATLLLRRGAAVDARCTWARLTPTHTAAAAGRGDVCAVLAGAGADVEAADAEGRTPIYHAGGASMALQLLSAGAQLFVRDDGGATPLCSVVSRSLGGSKGLVSVVQLMLNEAVVDPSVQDNEGVSPLHHAAKRGLLRVLLLLLERGADPCARTCTGWTPLHYACAVPEGRDNVSLNVLEALVEAGGDMDAAATDGTTPRTLMQRHAGCGSGAGLFRAAAGFVRRARWTSTVAMAQMWHKAGQMV